MTMKRFTVAVRLMDGKVYEEELNEPVSAVFFADKYREENGLDFYACRIDR